MEPQDRRAGVVRSAVGADEPRDHASPEGIMHVVVLAGGLDTRLARLAAGSYGGAELASTLEHLECLGWVLPDESEFGVRYCAPIDEASISFPSAAYEEGGGR